MHTAYYNLDSRDGVNLLCSSLVPMIRASRIEHNQIPELKMATKQLLPLDGLNVLHFYLCALSTLIWLVVALHLAVALLLRASFIACFISRFFPPERRVALQLTETVAILAHKCILQDTRKSSTMSYILEQSVDKNIDPNAAYDVFRDAGEIKLQPTPSTAASSLQNHTAFLPLKQERGLKPSPYVCHLWINGHLTKSAVPKFYC